jgi:CheY-like chemotaxis protein
MALILVIDDEAPIRANLIRMLRMEQHDALEAADGRVGLALAREHAHAIALILCDVMMPDTDGFAVLHALQADPALRHLPLVFLSASAEPERLNEGLQRGAVAYLTKPFKWDHLREIIQLHQHRPKLP